MPKVIINKKAYKTSDIGSWVVKWLHKAGKRMQDLAAEMLITQPALSYKIKHNTFSYGDLLTIFDYLNVPDEEILFVMKISGRRVDG